MADESFEVDPAIAEAMGFSGFGMQPNKKRKFDINDGFVDPDSAGSSHFSKNNGNGANSLPLGTRVVNRTGSAVVTATNASNLACDKERNASNSLRPDEASLEALRHGVRNGRGDMVYFLPSFLENPWQSQRQQK
nr:hypothetical protein CFP56_01322 [Quercus suber]